VFSVCCIFTNRCGVTASNAVDPSNSLFTSLLAGDCLTTHSLLQLTNFQAGGHLTRTFYSSHCRLKILLKAAGSRYINSARTVAVQLLLSEQRRKHNFLVLFAGRNYPQEAEWTPFQTHYFSENLVAQGIEPKTSGSLARNSDH
jgi:hypothetical protein